LLKVLHKDWLKHQFYNFKIKLHWVFQHSFFYAQSRRYCLWQYIYYVSGSLSSALSESLSSSLSSFRWFEVQIFSQVNPPSFQLKYLFCLHYGNYSNVHRSIPLIETIILSTNLPIFGRYLYPPDRKNVKNHFATLCVIDNRPFFLYTHID